MPGLLCGCWKANSDLHDCIACAVNESSTHPLHPIFFLRQCLSLNLKLSVLARKAVGQFPGILQSPLPTDKFTSTLLWDFPLYAVMTINE